MKSNNRALTFFSIAASTLLVLGAFVAVWLISSGSPSKQAEAQSSEPTPTAQAEKPAQISVRGSGIIQAKPDTLLMNIGVSIQDSNVKAVQGKVTAAMNAMEAKIKAAGVAEKDYRTTVYNVEPVMDYSGGDKGQPAKLTGFRITNMLEITLRDPSKAPELLDSLVDAGANTVYGMTYTFADSGNLAKQAYDGAVKDAEERAGRLANLSGLKLGRILSVSESSVGSGPYYGDKGAASGMGAGGAVIAPGQQSIQVDVIVTYEAGK